MGNNGYGDMMNDGGYCGMIGGMALPHPIHVHIPEPKAMGTESSRPRATFYR